MALFQLRAPLGRAASDILDAEDDRAKYVFEPLPRTLGPPPAFRVVAPGSQAPRAGGQSMRTLCSIVAH